MARVVFGGAAAADEWCEEKEASAATVFYFLVRERPVEDAFRALEFRLVPAADVFTVFGKRAGTDVMADRVFRAAPAGLRAVVDLAGPLAAFAVGAVAAASVACLAESRACNAERRRALSS